MKNSEIIHNFYQSFSEGNAERMIANYHENIEFKDPAFGTLKGARAKNMWRMLLSRNNDIQISYEILEVTKTSAKVNWTARYNYGPQQRKVINHVTAYINFENAKIIKHTDEFSLWIWSRQALGISGLFLGWTGFMKKKIQQKTSHLLENYISKNKV